MNMRKTFIRLLLVTMLLSLASVAFAAYDMTGRWLIEGGGYAKKDILRVELSDEGTLDILSKTENGTQYITGYTLNIRLDASKLGIKAWNNTDTATFQVPVPMPEFNPTVNKPFELPAVTVDRMHYQVTFTSINSGTVKIYGFMDVDTAGTIEIDSLSAVWKQGTPKPNIDDKSSGCNTAGLSLFTVLLGTPLMVLMRRKQNSTI